MTSRSQSSRSSCSTRATSSARNGYEPEEVCSGLRHLLERFAPETAPGGSLTFVSRLVETGALLIGPDEIQHLVGHAQSAGHASRPHSPGREQHVGAAPEPSPKTTSPSCRSASPTGLGGPMVAAARLGRNVGQSRRVVADGAVHVAVGTKPVATPQHAERAGALQREGTISPPMAWDRVRVPSNVLALERPAPCLASRDDGNASHCLYEINLFGLRTCRAPRSLDGHR